ncbi:CBS domain-containing protein [Xylophilus sp. Kf1]|nr:CBS domain-containing protein [Xylophilus sp. Kf1]
MFHVYGVAGRLYAGSAANLPVVPVQRIERLDAVHTFMVDEHPQEEPGGTGAPPAPPRSHRASEAVAAYGDVASPPQRLPKVASQVMTGTVVTVQADATLFEAAAWMRREQVGQAPVLDERQQLVGLLGREHILLGLADPHQPVRNLMASPVPAPLPDTDVHLVAKVMLQSGLPGLPVVDADGGLCGFVSRGDLLQVLADEPALEAWA